ncbi:MAG: 4Fe-4S binding protein [Candidatus Magnetoovum sp. WYHC-5]|nr:4Fe-4S binding protein [Candidatus Magnetoovum sp. WYHC-5]
MYFIEIDVENCDGCMKCYYMCPKMVFEIKEGKAALFDAANCSGCMSCVEICPSMSISIRQI